MTNNCILSATSLIGDDVKNSLGENLGSIKDVMICTDTNEVQYYVLSFGGFMGLGNKLFAIPPQAMLLDTVDKKFILNVNREKLESAPGFDDDQWPNFADPTFAQETYGHYGYEYTAAL